MIFVIVIIGIMIAVACITVAIVMCNNNKSTPPERKDPVTPIPTAPKPVQNNKYSTLGISKKDANEVMDLIEALYELTK
jgi:hypothetical protein